MFVTLELLAERGACQTFLDFFAKHFPDGAELMHLIQKAHLPYSSLHWGFEHLDADIDERNAYWEKVQVSNSNGVIRSDHVEGSLFVVDSSQVSSSESVYNSKNVEESERVIESEMVYNSHHIAKSTFVDHSSRVLQSINVTNSQEVYSSNYILCSNSVFESINVASSSVIWKSENITDSHFCFGCHNIKNSMFFENASDGEYLLFNKPIDKTRFEAIRKQFDRFGVQLSLTEEWPDYRDKIPVSHSDYRKHFKRISDEFWRWVRTLPGYSSDIMYSLTFNPMFLA